MSTSLDERAHSDMKIPGECLEEVATVQCGPCAWVASCTRHLLLFWRYLGKDVETDCCKHCPFYHSGIIRLGKVPKAWKLSHVVPVPKAPKQHDPNNYRHISLLSILSKVLEKHIYAEIICHIEELHPLSDCQWGFRDGCSTVAALLSTTHDWLQCIESGTDICAVSFWLQKKHLTTGSPSSLSTPFPSAHGTVLLHHPACSGKTAVRS